MARYLWAGVRLVAQVMSLCLIEPGPHYIATRLPQPTRNDDGEKPQMPSKFVKIHSTGVIEPQKCGPSPMERLT